MQVDVITPTLKERDCLLAEAKASVAQQTHPEMRHLIAVDNSREGPARVRNALVAQATADWLVFLDDDDLLDPTFTEWHLKHALQTSADVVYALCRYPPNRARRTPITEFDVERLRRGNYIPMTALVRRAAFCKVGGFKPEARFEDYRLWLDLLEAGFRFSHLPKVCWTYRIHGDPWRPLVSSVPSDPAQETVVVLETFEFRGQTRYRCPANCGFDTFTVEDVLKHMRSSCMRFRAIQLKDRGPGVLLFYASAEELKV
jgi:glycosyltransferase involved in cell wall biosynthesis